MAKEPSYYVTCHTLPFLTEYPMQRGRSYMNASGNVFGPSTPGIAADVMETSSGYCTESLAHTE